MGGLAGRVSWVRLLLGDLGEGLPAPGNSSPKVYLVDNCAKRRLTSPDVLAPDRDDGFTARQRHTVSFRRQPAVPSSDYDHAAEPGFHDSWRPRILAESHR